MIYLIEHPELEAGNVLVSQIVFNKIIICKVINQAHLFVVFS